MIRDMTQTLEEKRAYSREKMRERRRTPEYRESERQRKHTPEYRAYHRELMRKRNQDPQQRKAKTEEQTARRQRQRAAIWQAQQGLCYLCGTPLSEDLTQVFVDHDHSCCSKTQENGSLPGCARCRRGAVHPKCNLLIGLAGDDPARLRRIADNLEAAQALMAGLPYQATLGF